MLLLTTAPTTKETKTRKFPSQRSQWKIKPNSKTQLNRKNLPKRKNQWT